MSIWDNVKRSDVINKPLSYWVLPEKMETFKKRCGFFAFKPCRECGTLIPVFQDRYGSAVYDEWKACGATLIILGCPECGENTTPTTLNESDVLFIWPKEKRSKQPTKKLVK